MTTQQPAVDKPQDIMDFDFSGRREARPQEYYDEIKARFAEERDLRLAYRPAGHRAVHVRPRR